MQQTEQQEHQPDPRGEGIPRDVLGRAMLVLRAVADAEPIGAAATQLARRTGLARPTTQRVLGSLAREGLVLREDGGCWRLGAELPRLAAVRSPDPGCELQTVLRRLAAQSGADAFLSVREGDEAHCTGYVAAERSTAAWWFRRGTRLPLGVAAAGVAILAYLDDAAVDRCLQRMEPARQFGALHSADQIRQRVAAARVQGYAVNPGLIFGAVPSLAAAGFDAGGEPCWAIGLTGLGGRGSVLDRARERQLGHALAQTARMLSRSVHSPVSPVGAAEEPGRYCGVPPTAPEAAPDVR